MDTIWYSRSTIKVGKGIFFCFFARFVLTLHPKILKGIVLNVMEFKRSIVITGGAGFIGSHVVRLFVNKYPEYKIINLDKLTYAGNLANLKDLED